MVQEAFEDAVEVDYEVPGSMVYFVFAYIVGGCHAGDLCCGGLFESFIVEAAGEHFGTGIDAAKVHVLVKEILTC